MQLDHIGVVVANLESGIRYYHEYFGYTWDGRIHADPLQRARIALLLPANSDFAIELTEPTSADSPLMGPLKRGNRLLHLCYRVPNIQKALTQFVALGSRIISEPNPAEVLFTQDREAVELIEAAAPTTDSHGTDDQDNER